MTAQTAIATLPARPAARAVRFVIHLKGGESFTVLCHRGSVPRERVGAMLGATEIVTRIERERAL